MAKLTIIHEDENINEVSLCRGQIVIGRKPSNDIIINMKEVSSTHAKLFNYGGHYFIQDLDSLNGTYVNGKKINKHRLNDGDKIVIGYYTLLFRIDSSDNAVNCAVKQLPTGETVLIEKSDTDINPSKLLQSQSEAKAHLFVISGSSDKSFYIITEEHIVIGRKIDAQIRLKSLLAPKVAAIIEKKTECFYINSPKKRLIKINNTFLEEEHKLKSGDIIDTGSLTLKYELK